MATMASKVFEVVKKKNLNDLAINVKEEEKNEEIIKVEDAPKGKCRAF